MKILATATHLGSVNLITPAIRILNNRGHNLTVYATGNESQASGFGDINYHRIDPREEDYPGLVKGFDAVLAGMSGYKTPDGYFLRSANLSRIPTIAVQDLDVGYKERLGDKSTDFPAILAVMDQKCLETIAREFEEPTGKELLRRTRIIGWAAFDSYAEQRDRFTEKDRVTLLKGLSLDPNTPINVHFTQNVHPDTDYMRPIQRPYEVKKAEFDYELGLTRKVFEIASSLGLRLIVKPHPGEKFKENFTEDLVSQFGFVFIPASACNTRQLILASNSTTAGRSTCLVESCLFDRNTGGIFPDADYRDIAIYPPVASEAIPYTQQWNGIAKVMQSVTSSDVNVNQELSEKRKRFSVDGKASERLADLVESLR